MKLYFTSCGVVTGPGFAVQRGHRRLAGAVLPITVAILERPQGLCLVDAGYGAETALDPARFPGKVAAAFQRLQVGPSDPVAVQLALIGARPADVRDIVLTHSDIDHTGGLRDFPHATIHVCRAEYEWGIENRPRFSNPKAWRHGAHFDIYDFDSGPFGPFAAARDLFGDGSVITLPAPGHTPGHVIVHLKGERPAYHLGDAVFDMRELHSPPRPCFAARVLSRAQARLTETLERIAELRAQAPDETLFVPTHDARVFAGLPRLNAREAA